MKAHYGFGLLVVLALVVPANADFTMTFEETPFQTTDVLAVQDYYSGVTFGSSSTGSPLVSRLATTNSYNVSSTNGNSWNAGYYWVNGFVGVTSALDNSGNDGKISFDNQDATFVELRYCASSTFWLEAYRADGTLIDSDSGAGNLRHINGNEAGPGTLRVDWNGSDHIAWVIVHDAGNFWVIDDVSTDASGVQSIPAPSAGLLGVLGFGAMFVSKRLLRC